MNDPHRGSRYRLDFVTNPAYAELVAEINQMKGRELTALLGAGRGENQFQFNHQTGICDGIDRVLTLMRRLEEEAGKSMGGSE
jgi:hypothetical protein